jgi:hypothetical protein
MAFKVNGALAVRLSAMPLAKALALTVTLVLIVNGPV